MPSSFASRFSGAWSGSGSFILVIITVGFLVFCGLRVRWRAGAIHAAHPPKPQEGTKNEPGAEPGRRRNDCHQVCGIQSPLDWGGKPSFRRVSADVISSGYKTKKHLLFFDSHIYMISHSSRLGGGLFWVRFSAGARETGFILFLPLQRCWCCLW